MDDFLVDLSTQQREFESYQQAEGRDLTLAASKNLSEIKLYQKVTEEPVGQDELRDVRKHHLARLAEYRKRRDWQGWCQEDDLDMEGERILAEIKNFKTEYMFQTGFY